MNHTPSPFIPIVNMRQARELIAVAELAKRPLLIRGGPGLGKTEGTRDHVRERRAEIMDSPLKSEILKAYAEGGPLAGSPVSLLPEEEQVYGYIDTRLPYYDPTDLKGFPCLDKEAGVSRWLPPAVFPLQSLVEKGILPARGLWCLEELASAPKATLAAAFQIVLDREINGAPIAPGWSIVATSNSLSDMSVVNALPSPLVSRFMHCELRTTVAEWADWAMKSGVSEKLVAYFRFKPEALFSFNPANWQQDTPYCCPRSAHILSDTIAAWESVAPGKPIPRHLIVATIGKLVGDEFYAFLDIWDKLPKMGEIISAPDSTPIPTEPSALFAISAALARKTDRENIDPIFRYIARMERTYQIATVKDICRVTPAMANTIQFQQFVLRPENKEIFLQVGAEYN